MQQAEVMEHMLFNRFSILGLAIYMYHCFVYVVTLSVCILDLWSSWETMGCQWSMDTNGVLNDNHIHGILASQHHIHLSDKVWHSSIKCIFCRVIANFSKDTMWKIMCANASTATRVEAYQPYLTTWHHFYSTLYGVVCYGRCIQMLDMNTHIYILTETLIIWANSNWYNTFQKCPSKQAGRKHNVQSTRTLMSKVSFDLM